MHFSSALSWVRVGRNIALTALFLTIGPLWVSAQVTITVNGTITGVGTGHDYSLGQSISLNFSLNDFEEAPANGVASSGVYYQWVEESTSHPQIYDGVSGTGLDGVWGPSTAFDGSAYAYLSTHQASSPNQLIVTVGNNVFPGDMGLSVNGQTVTRIMVNAQLTGFSPTVGAVLPDSTDYLGGFVGTYNASATGGDTMIRTYLGGSFRTSTFDVNSVTISAVPEPANMGLIMAGVGFFWVAACRRRPRGC